MKLIESRSPTTLTPQTPLPLTPSAIKRQFVVPTAKPAAIAGDTAAATGGGVATTSGDVANSTAASDTTTVNSTSVTTVGESVAATGRGVATPGEGMAAPLVGLADQDGDTLPQLDDVIPSIQDKTLTGEHTQDDLLPSVEDVAGLSGGLVEEDSSNQMFPLGFPDQPAEDQSVPSEDQMISTEDRVIPDIAMTAGQESMEFGTSALDVTPHDPSYQQFEQSTAPTTNQSNLLNQLPQQQTDSAQQLEDTSQQ